MHKPARPTWLLFAVCVGAPLLVGFLGSLATRSAIPTWYAHLTEPPLTPPSWAFGVVWTVLYVMMGWASYLVVRQGVSRPRVRPAITFYVPQLVLNGVWSPVFFGLRAPWAALAVIVLLVPALWVTMVLFRRVSHAAGLLLVPYLAWVCFATYLNAGFAWLNR
jgi:translocator protein